MSKKKLKPCPFCGSFPTAIRIANGPPLRPHIILCQICEAQSGHKEHIEWAVDAWNRREA